MPQYGPLRLMADRIARNREVAGLHYRSDTWAGLMLAAGCFDIMLKLDAVRGDPAVANSLPASAYPSVDYAKVTTIRPPPTRCRRTPRRLRSILTACSTVP